MAEGPTLVWFRDDLRLADNPALGMAVASGRPILGLYIIENGPGRPMGAASRWRLHGSLQSLGADLTRHGARLLLLKGDAASIAPRVAASIQATGVYWNRRYGAAEIEVDRGIKAKLGEQGAPCESANGALLYEPWTVKTQKGEPMRVFTPFWRAARALGEPVPPTPAPKKLRGAEWRDRDGLHDQSLDSFALEPRKPDWAKGFAKVWGRGEAAGRKRLASFIDETLAGYAESRDRPDKPGTSRLSPYLRFGDVSPRQAWHAATQHHLAGAAARGLDRFLTELGWREFCYHLHFHQPDLATKNFQSRFDAFPWRNDEEGLEAWKRGRTGYPMVDAGMRQLWTTGWMHNRVRMIVASFLVKHLLIDWREGEQWFWDTLVDADSASNTANWQWVAGTGADAAPYFRIFNPVLQGEKFDPDGAYVREWIPEIAKLPNDVIHRPWEADAATLKKAGVELGKTYPKPIVDHAAARQRALAALSSIRATA